jgi:bifunctional non-homologous end joining protein LigD
MAEKQRALLDVGGREVEVSSLGKVLFPRTGFTKADLINYYVRAGKYLIRHLCDRPLTMKLFPDGVEARVVFRHNAPVYTPKWIKQVDMLRSDGKSHIHSIVVNDLPTLIWLANAADVEMHPLLSRSPNFDRPATMVFDFDPGASATFMECVEVAFWVRKALQQVGLESWLKSSGSKGLHLSIPLNTPVTYKQTSTCARAIARAIELEHPDRVVSEMAKSLRGGKVFIDWSQNARHKSMASVYSLRAKPNGPFVSFPIDWTELKKLLKKGEPAAFLVEPDEALARLEREGDAWLVIGKMRQKLRRPS